MTVAPGNLPDNAPFDPRQKGALDALIPTLNPQQATWLSGYFAGLGQILDKGSAAAAPRSLADSAPVAAVPLTILYGSESGNAESCADKAAKAARQAGFAPSVSDMADYDRSKLPTEANILVIVSTWGEGDPPEGAIDFHQFFMGDSAPALNKTRYAVFALGDTSYADFCECGKQFDKRFAELGAQRVLERVDADVDFEESFAKWLAVVIPAFARFAGAGSAGTADRMTTAARAASQQEVPVFGKKHPFPAKVTKLINLNGRHSAKETCHIELSLDGSGMTYEPGDVAGVIPRNCPEVVEDFIRCAGFRGDEPVEGGQGAQSLREVLETQYDITSVNASLMKKYAPIARNKDLEAFLEPDKKESLKDWLFGREICDLLHDFPPAEALTPDQLLGILRKMPPRLYSIASSLRAHPGEVHLTVCSVRYNSHGKSRKGVCSTYLNQRVKPGDSVSLYTHNNKNFFLPENGDTPIIMVGPGTGIAPFRAFVEERVALGQKGKNWLFFGDQHFNSDFLYQLEWMDYLKSGALSRFDVAFSRDTDHKVYVQHRMLEKAKDLYAWMKEGAWFYVCGDASRMAVDVHQALVQIYAEQGGLSTEAAEAEVKELQKSKRYQRDVY